MRVKRFVARTLPEAMAQVKGDLGSEAIILHTQPVRIGGFLGFFGTRMIEVVAAAEQAPPRSLAAAVGGASAPPSSPIPQQAAAAVHPVSAGLSQTAAREQSPPGRLDPAYAQAQPATMILPQTAASAAVAAQAVSTHVLPPAVAAEAAVSPKLDAVVQDMRTMLDRLMQRLDTPVHIARLDPELKEVYLALTAAGINTHLAADVVKRVRERAKRAKGQADSARAIARALLERELERVQTISLQQGGRRVVALVGPTGVGKTTTLAKLAALHALGKKVRVSLITADTYRIAAVEQLRTYCEILQVPLEVVYDPAELKAALGRQHRSDLILVDTAGRSPKNPEHMAELNRYLGELKPDETYLVLSLTSNERDAALVAEAYEEVHFDRFLFTKLDETSQIGLLYTLAVQYRKPLSYVTTGQNVPDDIEVVDPGKLANAILGE